MNTDNFTEASRLLTSAELATVIRLFRDMRQWSQEQLSELSGLSVRTIQRIEQAHSSSLDTRRAIARAFEIEDIDIFSKPFAIPSKEAVEEQKKKFEQENIMLAARPLTTGRQLATLAETCSMDLSEPAFDMDREAEEAFAALVDVFREYRDCADLYNESSKFDIYDDMQTHIDELLRLKVSLRSAERNVLFKFGGDEEGTKPVRVAVAYVVAFRLGQEPNEFATPRKVGIKF